MRLNENGYRFYVQWEQVRRSGAYYVRPVYLIVWLTFSGIVIFCLTKTKKRILSAAILGMLIVAIPQVCINRAHFNTSNSMIQTQSGIGKPLYLRQLEWGIYVQKYETNADEEAKNTSWDDKWRLGRS